MATPAEIVRADPWGGCNPLDPAFIDDPFPALNRLREHDPVNDTPIGIVRLTRYADCVRLLKDVKAGVRLSDGQMPDFEGPGGGEFMLSQDPPGHTRLRRLVSRAFTPRAVEALRPRMEQLVDELLDAAAERGAMDVIADLALPVPATVICEMLGVPLEDRDAFTVWTAESTHGLARMTSSPEVLARADAAAEKLSDYFARLIEERRDALGDDLLSTLIRAADDGDRLTPQEALVQASGLLVAGFETTIGLIGNGVRELLRNPDELARLRADPGLIESAVEECLRFAGPIILTGRILHDEAEFGGRVLAKDTSVWAMLFSANRDPRQFPEPERFDVGRTPNEHLAFGGGTHFCLGAHLARLEAQVAIGGLVRRFEHLELESDTVEWGPSLFRVPARLPIRAETG